MCFQLLIHGRRQFGQRFQKYIDTLFRIQPLGSKLLFKLSAKLLLSSSQTDNLLLQLFQLFLCLLRICYSDEVGPSSQFVAVNATTRSLCIQLLDIGLHHPSIVVYTHVVFLKKYIVLHATTVYVVKLLVKHCPVL